MVINENYWLERVSRAKEFLQYTEKCLAAFRERKYNCLDTVYHKELGKGFITKIQIGLQEESMDVVLIGPENKKKEVRNNEQKGILAKLYYVTFLKCEGWVEESDLISDNETSKELYG